MPVTQLSQIGQLAFRGMKELNRIQSIVFETAYYTNENVLVCAPTGAGKTNIALLAVMHTVEQVGGGKIGGGAPSHDVSSTLSTLSPASFRRTSLRLSTWRP